MGKAKENPASIDAEASLKSKIPSPYDSEMIRRFLDHLHYSLIMTSVNTTAGQLLDVELLYKKYQASSVVPLQFSRESCNKMAEDLKGALPVLALALATIDFQNAAIAFQEHYKSENLEILFKDDGVLLLKARVE